MRGAVDTAAQLVEAVPGYVQAMFVQYGALVVCLGGLLNLCAHLHVVAAAKYGVTV